MAIDGAHVVLYSKDAEADRVFMRHALGFPSVDAGRGWDSMSRGMQDPESRS